MLDQLRQQLEQVNKSLFSVLGQRRSVVSQIQEVKETSWDAGRETIVFGRYIESNPDSHQRDDLLYSLIIESDAAAFGYPQWSQGAHLKSGKATGAVEMINPVLLRMRNETQYQALDLRDEYKNQIESIWENQKS